MGYYGVCVDAGIGAAGTIAGASVDTDTLHGNCLCIKQMPDRRECRTGTCESEIDEEGEFPEDLVWLPDIPCEIHRLYPSYFSLSA